MGVPLLIEPVGLKLPFGKKIIKSAEYKAYISAREIIERAHEKATMIEVDAKQAYQDEKKRGYDEGLRNGNDAIAEKMMDTISDTINYFETVEVKIVDVVLVALRKILSDFDQVDIVKRVVKTALQIARNQKHVTIRVHPDIKDALTKHFAEIASSAPSVNFIEVEADVRVSKDGCIIDSDMGIIDASLQKQISILEKALRASLGSHQDIPHAKIAFPPGFTIYKDAPQDEKKTIASSVKTSEEPVKKTSKSPAKIKAPKATASKAKKPKTALAKKKANVVEVKKKPILKPQMNIKSKIKVQSIPVENKKAPSKAKSKSTTKKATASKPKTTKKKDT